MIERVAAALFNHEAEPVPWDSVASLPTVKEIWVTRARVAIEAMREPTDDVLLAFVKRRWGEQWEFAWNNQERENCKLDWQAVINSILEEQ